MNNADDILKRILLNMRYNPKKTLNENKFNSGNIISEAPELSPGQQIPTTMNQIMQFQDYVWSVIEKDMPATNPNEKDRSKKLYNSSLCSVKPCNKKEAVDGLWGDSTISAWAKYKDRYKKYNPDWDKDRVDYKHKVLGQEIPTTTTQIKNFQKWYFEEVEKPKETAPNTKVYFTKLCVDKQKYPETGGKFPCSKTQAIDGNWGDNTKLLWDTNKTKYQTANPNWWANVEWSAREDRNVLSQVNQVGKNVSKLFSPENPSGWDGKTPLPSQAKMLKAYGTSPGLSGSKWKNSYQDANYYYLGWDLNNNVFPYPKKYAQQEIDAKSKSILILNPKKNTSSSTIPRDPNIVIDTETGGLSNVYKQNQANKEIFNTNLEIAKYKPVKDMTDWNKILDKQNTLIPQYCTPLKRSLSFKPGEIITLPQGMDSFTLNAGTIIYDGQNAGAFGLNLTWYISMSEICQDNGGLWVYQDTKNEGNWFSEKTTSSCLCRYMNNLDVDTIGIWGMGKGGSGNIAKQLQQDKTVVEKSYSDYAHAAFTVLEIGLAIASMVATVGASAGVVSPTLIAGSELAIAAEAAGVPSITIAGSASAAALAANLMIGSTVAGVLDSATYYAEGDKYMGGMMMALTLIPGGEALTLLNKAKTFVEVGGKQGLESLLKKKTLGTLTAEEAVQLEKIQIELASNSAIVEMATTQRINQSTATRLSDVIKSTGANLRDTVKLIGYLYQKIGMFPKLTFQIGVSTYGFDELYLAIYGRDEDRQNSDIRKLWYLIQNKELPENLQQEIAEKAQSEMSSKIMSSQLVLDTRAMEDAKNGRSAYYRDGYNKRKPNKRIIIDVKYEGIQTPSLLDVEENGELIFINMSGSSISQIQELIETRWAKTPYSKMLKSDVIDGVFNQNMENVIKKFQSEMEEEEGFEKMKSNGIVDNKTLKYLKYSKQNESETIEKLPIKPIDPLSLTFNRYDFFRWSERTKKWEPVDYEAYKAYEKLGVKVTKQLKDVELSLPKTDVKTKKELKKNKTIQEEIEMFKRLIK
jgi:hypothetical protein